MTLTDAQVRALLAEATVEVYEEHQPDCHHCEGARRVKAVCAEVLAQRERRCETCAAWQLGGSLPTVPRCVYPSVTKGAYTRATWGCADWTAKETP